MASLEGRVALVPELEGMMTPEQVAEAVLFVLSRPRNQRAFEVDLQPMTEPSWG